ncbi:hypothetical protein BP5796_06731 [Coleophoma crateriformis]|uniref:BZIP domain-containing protein n=1 Tax=Coleophoma crateriformis TaxID=565419 RepID=A0A3D8RPL2_9HELO|nr:hypothetical protein BP5796_06731 [Coleophoma crateriformis]
MASSSSNSPEALVDQQLKDDAEPRPKGARGGKRSVTHLSKAQLARKRANDREAQRNIRARTKEHIENLERKVKELEAQGHSARDSSVERVIERNRQLECEIAKLKAQVQVQEVSPEADDLINGVNGMTGGNTSMMGEWTEQDAPSCPWDASEAMPVPIVVPQHIKIDPNAPFVPMDIPVYSAQAQSHRGFVIPEPDNTESLYTPISTSAWEDPSMTSTAPGQPWTAFAPTFQQPSRFPATKNNSGLELTDHTNPPVPIQRFQNSTCWQAQPSVYAWQISTKLSSPVTLVDELMIGVIQSQRHLHMTADVTGQYLIGPTFPSVHILFNQPGPPKPLNPGTLTLTETMARYSAVLSNRGFQLIPEKLASFMAMYRFVQWQISPSQTTYGALHEWQAPRPSQLIIPHPAWMDLPPWGKFRDRIIENQDKYGTLEFQNCYATNLNVNFPGNGLEALVFEDGQIKVSNKMERHLGDLSNMSMRKPFADKYPEFADVCRFDEE